MRGREGRREEGRRGTGEGGGNVEKSFKNIKKKDCRKTDKNMNVKMKERGKGMMEREREGEREREREMRKKKIMIRHKKITLDRTKPTTPTINSTNYPPIYKP